VVELMSPMQQRKNGEARVCRSCPEQEHKQPPRTPHQVRVQDTHLSPKQQQCVSVRSTLGLGLTRTTKNEKGLAICVLGWRVTIIADVGARNSKAIHALMRVLLLSACLFSFLVLPACGTPCLLSSPLHLDLIVVCAAEIEAVISSGHLVGCMCPCAMFVSS
jgi:hypothetical protein